MKKTILLIALFLTTLAAQAQTALWNTETLLAAKEFSPGTLLSIIVDADSALKKKIVTVVDKEMIPASGDKHDYMSMGRYWWPDEEKVDGLPYVRKDGLSNPELEKLDRKPLSAFATGIENLAIAYYITKDEKYAKKAVENLKIWFINPETKMNPNMNFGQTIPGKNEGKGRGEGVLDTYSFVEMLDGVELLKSSTSFFPSDQEDLRLWFVEYIKWMQTSEIGIDEQNADNNHGTAYDAQLIRFALFVDDFELARKVCNEFPSKRLYPQIEPNGAQLLELKRTTALGYSTFNLTHYLDVAKMASTLNIDILNAKSDDGRGILKAIEFLVPFIGIDLEDFPYQQINDWRGVQIKLCWQLFRVDKMLQKKDYEKYYEEHIDPSEGTKDSVLY